MKYRKPIYPRVRLFVILLFAASSGCASLSIVRSEVIAHGEVVYVSHQGGFYGIVTDSGDRLYPVNLPVEFQQDRITVIVTYRVTEKSTYQEWGTPIQIIRIRRS